MARGSLLFIFFYEPYSINYGRINIDALLHCLLRYEVIERPYMLEAYIIDILFLSFFPLLRLHISLYFLFPLHIKGFLKKDFSCYNNMIDTSYSDLFFWILIIQSNGLVTRSSTYYFLFYFIG